jgi:hypothetical protein
VAVLGCAPVRRLGLLGPSDLAQQDRKVEEACGMIITLSGPPVPFLRLREPARPLQQHSEVGHRIGVALRGMVAQELLRGGEVATAGTGRGGHRPGRIGVDRRVGQTGVGSVGVPG